MLFSNILLATVAPLLCSALPQIPGYYGEPVGHLPVVQARHYLPMGDVKASNALISNNILIGYRLQGDTNFKVAVMQPPDQAISL